MLQWSREERAAFTARRGAPGKGYPPDGEYEAVCNVITVHERGGQPGLLEGEFTLLYSTEDGEEPDKWVAHCTARPGLPSVGEQTLAASINKWLGGKSLRAAKHSRCRLRVYRGRVCAVYKSKAKAPSKEAA